MKTKKIILVVLTIVLSFGFLLAQAAEGSPEAAPAQAEIKTGVWDMMVKIVDDSEFWGYLTILIFIGGMVYWVIRFKQLYLNEKIDSGQVYLKLKGHIKNDQIDEAVKIADSFITTTMGFIFAAGIKGYRDARSAGKTGRALNDQVQNAFDEANLQKFHKLDGGLWWFDVMAQVCTYLGLLGTIWGLLDAFNALAFAPESQKQTELTKGIAKAIGTTALGLIAAIPLYVLKGVLLDRAQKLIAEVDEYSVKVMNQLIYLSKE